MFPSKGFHELCSVLASSVTQLASSESRDVGTAGRSTESSSTQTTRSTTSTTTLLASTKGTFLSTNRLELRYFGPFFENQPHGKRVSEAWHPTLVIPTVIADQIRGFIVGNVQRVGLEQPIGSCGVTCFEGHHRAISKGELKGRRRCGWRRSGFTRGGSRGRRVDASGCAGASPKSRQGTWSYRCATDSIRIRRRQQSPP